MKYCSSPDCIETISDRNKSGLCNKCRSSLYYWKEMDTDRIKARTEKLKFWEHRLEYFVEFIIEKPKKKLKKAA